MVPLQKPLSELMTGILEAQRVFKQVSDALSCEADREMMEYAEYHQNGFAKEKVNVFLNKLDPSPSE